MNKNDNEPELFDIEVDPEESSPDDIDKKIDEFLKQRSRALTELSKTINNNDGN